MINVRSRFLNMDVFEQGFLGTNQAEDPTRSSKIQIMGGSTGLRDDSPPFHSFWAPRTTLLHCALRHWTQASTLEGHKEHVLTPSRLRP